MTRLPIAAVLLFLPLAPLGACGTADGDATGDGGTGDSAGDGDGDGDGDSAGDGDGDGDATGDGDGDGDGSCVELYGSCTTAVACCGDTVSVGSTDSSDPGWCEALDDPGCTHPGTCFTDADCCSPTTCLTAQLGAAGICG